MRTTCKLHVTSTDSEPIQQFTYDFDNTNMFLKKKISIMNYVGVHTKLNVHT